MVEQWVPLEIHGSTMVNYGLFIAQPWQAWYQHCRPWSSNGFFAGAVQPWFISTEDGAVFAAHCTCMAGLGETCSHVASTMFYVEAAVRMREKQTLTEVTAYWRLPSANSQVQYAPIKKINFTSSDSLKKHLKESFS